MLFDQTLPSCGFWLRKYNLDRNSIRGVGHNGPFGFGLLSLIGHPNIAAVLRTAHRQRSIGELSLWSNHNNLACTDWGRDCLLLCRDLPVLITPLSSSEGWPTNLSNISPTSLCGIIEGLLRSPQCLCFTSACPVLTQLFSL